MLEEAQKFKTSRTDKSYTYIIYEMFPIMLQEMIEFNLRGEDGFETDGSAQRDYENEQPLRSNWYLQKKIVREVKMDHKYWDECEEKLEKYLRSMEPTTSDQQFLVSTEQDSDVTQSETSEEEYGKKKKKMIKKAAEKKDEKK